VEAVSQRAAAGCVFPWQDPAVDSAALMGDVVVLVGAELQQQQRFAAKAEDLGALVLVCVSGFPGFSLGGALQEQRGMSRQREQGWHGTDPRSSCDSLWEILRLPFCHSKTLIRFLLNSPMARGRLSPAARRVF
jgi:hypothetical protein